LKISTIVDNIVEKRISKINHEDPIKSGISERWSKKRNKNHISVCVIYQLLLAVGPSI